MCVCQLSFAINLINFVVQCLISQVLIAMVVCGRCGDEVTEAIQCSSCSSHFDFPCSGITEVGYRKLGERQATWRCANCKNAGRASVQALPSTTSPAVPPPVTLETIMRELSGMRQELAPLSNLASEVQLLRQELIGLKLLPERVQALDERLAAVEAVHEENFSIKSVVAKLEDGHQDIDQWLRSNNVEIKGVPMRDRENLFNIIHNIGEKISYPIDKNQINFVHRVPSNISSNKNIIVSFLHRYAKEDFIAAARSSKDPLLPQHIGISGSGRIFVNDHLTIKNKMLLSQTKSLAKEQNFQFVWVKHMKIFVKKDPTSKSFIISSVRDLQKLR